MDLADNTDTVVDMNFLDIKKLQQLSLNELYENIFDLPQEELSSLIQQCPTGLADDIRFVAASKLQYSTFLAKFTESIPQYLIQHPKETADFQSWLLTSIVPCLADVLQQPTDSADRYTEADALGQDHAHRADLHRLVGQRHTGVFQ